MRRRRTVNLHVLTDGECRSLPKPCPYTWCKFHLADVSRAIQRTERIEVCAQVLDQMGSGEAAASRVRELLGVARSTAYTWLRRAQQGRSDCTETCVLDVADREGVTLEDIGKILGVSRERVRQIEEIALRKVKGSVDA